MLSCEFFINRQDQKKKRKVVFWYLPFVLHSESLLKQLFQQSWICNHLKVWSLHGHPDKATCMCQKEKLCEHHQARQIYIQYSTNSEDEIAMLDASSEKTTRIVAIYNFFSRLNTVWKCHYWYTLTHSLPSFSGGSGTLLFQLVTSIQIPRYFY